MKVALLADAKVDGKAALETLLPGASVTVTGIRDSTAAAARRRLDDLHHAERRRLQAAVRSTIMDYTAACATSVADPFAAVSTTLAAATAAPIAMTIGGVATTGHVGHRYCAGWERLLQGTVPERNCLRISRCFGRQGWAL